MSKRFIDTELWDKTAFNLASPKIKLLTIFLTCKCDLIGVFKMSPMLINAYIGESVTEEEILSIPCDITKLSDGIYWLDKFCNFQYGELSEDCRPHKKYIQMLKQANLYDRVLIGYPKGINTLQEKDIDKDKEKDKEKKPIKLANPTLEEVKNYFKEKGYSEQTAERAFNAYSENNWHDSNNKPIKNWKLKMTNVWFKPENKIKKQSWY